ncbi:MAG: flagellar biosynthesis protein [Alphaproteobacteria bacterium]|jgi:flagellar biosynthesis protein
MYKPTNQHGTAQAIALKYRQNNSLNESKSAPKIVAKGHGTVAQEIIAIAEQHGVLVHKDDELSKLLGQLDLGQEIPEGLYHVIAELIAFSYVLQGKFPSSWKNTLQHIDFKE